MKKEDILQLIRLKLERENHVFNHMRANELKGDKGDPGYTPVFGVDYATPEQINAIATSIIEEVTPGLSDYLDEKIAEIMPKKGVNYFTNEDIETIKEIILEEVEDGSDGEDAEVDYDLINESIETMVSQKSAELVDIIEKHKAELKESFDIFADEMSETETKVLNRAIEILDQRTQFLLNKQTTLPDGYVTTEKIADNAVTVGKLQQISTNSLLGRATAGTGNVEVIEVSDGLEFSGTQIKAVYRTLSSNGAIDVGNSAGGTDTVVYQFTVPANFIDGTIRKGLKFDLYGSLSSTAETTTFKIKLNSVTCGTQATSNTNAGLAWSGNIVRTGATTGRAWGQRMTTSGGSAADTNTSIAGLDWTVAQTFELTIASTTASRGTARAIHVEPF